MADIKGTLDKKTPFGIWAKKFVKLLGLDFTVSDSEDGAPIFQSKLVQVTRGGDGDPMAITIFGEKQGEQIVLKGTDPKITSYWYDTLYTALELAGKVKPRNAGLPARDPRFDLPFAAIPGEYAAQFVSLDNAVIYWFGAITKYGAPGKLSRKPSTEERIVFIGDKCIYVTKPNSEVTRCMHIQQMTGLCTSVGTNQTGDHFVVFKMAPPEYDLHISGPNMVGLIEVVSAVFKYIHKGVKELPVTSVATAQDPVVKLQLNRPSGFEMTVIRPVTKVQLKTALDNFAKKHGITFEPAPPVGALAFASKAKEEAPPGVQATSSAGQPTATTTSSSQPKMVPKTDAFAVFLTKIGLEDYYFSLSSQGMDLDVLECVDEKDLKNFGLKDPAHCALIREKIQDTALIEKVHEDVAAAQADAKWTIKKTDDAVKKPEPAQPAAPAPQPAAPTAPRPPIVFDSDDDDDLDIALPAKGAEPKRVQMEICLDDSDDDLDLPPAPPPKKAPIVLDDDDDI